MLKILFLSCFLIILSCDLPSEANQDCDGIEFGLAEIDDCGICASGETGLVPNIGIDCCGICFGGHMDCSIPCDGCTDSEAINYDENAAIDDGSCIFNLCTEYLETNDKFKCDTNGSPPYNIGDQLGCETLETEFDFCYPECDDSFKLSDFEDKNILIIYEEDW